MLLNSQVFPVQKENPGRIKHLFLRLEPPAVPDPLMTGERASLPSELPDEVAALRKKVKLPVVVGFGVSTPEQASAVARFADGVVGGSALVRLGGDLAEDPELPLRVSERVLLLANAIARVGGKKRPAR